MLNFLEYILIILFLGSLVGMGWSGIRAARRSVEILGRFPTTKADIDKIRAHSVAHGEPFSEATIIKWRSATFAIFVLLVVVFFLNR